MKKLCLIVFMLSSSYLLSAQDNSTSRSDTSSSTLGKVKVKIKSTNPNRSHQKKHTKMDSTRTTGSYYNSTNGQDNTNTGVNNSTNSTQDNGTTNNGTTNTGTMNNSSQSTNNNSTNLDNTNTNTNNGSNGSMDNNNTSNTTGNFSTTMSNSATMNSALMAGMGLPVLETYVPSDLVNTLRTRYGASMYDITAVKGANSTDIYMVRTGMGNYTTTWVNADGTPATQPPAATTPANR